MRTENAPTTQDLATEINREHQACCQAASEALSHAMKCGDLLMEAKAALQHGQWQDWLAEHFSGSGRTARAYMRLAQHREQIEAKWQRSAVLPIGEALRMIAAPRTERRCPRETDEPNLLLTNPAAWEAMQQRHDEYRENAMRFMQEMTDLTENGTAEDIPKMVRYIRESHDMANGWALFKLKTERELGQLMIDMDEKFGKGFSEAILTENGYAEFQQAVSERLQELENDRCAPSAP